MSDLAVMSDAPTQLDAWLPGSNVQGVSLEPQLTALRHLAAIGTAFCAPELRGRTERLMRGELPDEDVARTVGDLGLMAGMVALR